MALECRITRQDGYETKRLWRKYRSYDEKEDWQKIPAQGLNSASGRLSPSMP
jgi:hypothetical protein